MEKQNVILSYTLLLKDCDLCKFAACVYPEAVIDGNKLDPAHITSIVLNFIQTVKSSISFNTREHVTYGPLRIESLVCKSNAPYADLLFAIDFTVNGIAEDTDDGCIEMAFDMVNESTVKVSHKGVVAANAVYKLEYSHTEYIRKAS